MSGRGTVLFFSFCCGSQVLGYFKIGSFYFIYLHQDYFKTDREKEWDFFVYIIYREKQTNKQKVFYCL